MCYLITNQKRWSRCFLPLCSRRRPTTFQSLPRASRKERRPSSGFRKKSIEFKLYTKSSSQVRTLMTLSADHGSVWWRCVLLNLNAKSLIADGPLGCLRVGQRDVFQQNHRFDRCDGGM